MPKHVYQTALIAVVYQATIDLLSKTVLLSLHYGQRLKTPKQHPQKTNHNKTKKKTQPTKRGPDVEAYGSEAEEYGSHENLPDEQFGQFVRVVW